MSEFTDRLAQLLDYLGYSAYKFSKEIGSSDAVISNIRAGHTKPSYDFLSKLLKKFEWLDMNWLIGGQGEMLKKPAHTPPSTHEKSPVFIEKMHEPPSPQQGKLPPKLPPTLPPTLENSSLEVEKCLDKERIILSHEATITALKEVIKEKEEKAQEKERIIQLLMAAKPTGRVKG